jgi:hypothetical protein
VNCWGGIFKCKRERETKRTSLRTKCSSYCRLKADASVSKWNFLEEDACSDSVLRHRSSANKSVDARLDSNGFETSRRPTQPMYQDSAQRQKADKTVKSLLVSGTGDSRSNDSCRCWTLNVCWQKTTVNGAIVSTNYLRTHRQRKTMKDWHAN